MTITATMAHKLSLESIENFKKSKSFGVIIDYIERSIKCAANVGKTSVTAPVGKLTKTNGDTLSENERRVIENELTTNGFAYSEHVENDRLWYTISW